MKARSTDTAATPAPLPRETASLSGHDDAQALFLETLRSGRFAHGWLITGPRGIGKATLAYRFARALLRDGTAADTLDISSEDPVFLRVKSGTHGNLRVVERGFQKSNPTKRAEIIDVADVRGIGDFFSKSAAEGGWRVVIVDEAETMNPSSANALLKVLEEPPPNAALFLVSHNPARLLDTIRSRCRQLTLRPLDATVVDRLISAHLPDLSGRDRALLARLSEGSIGRALELSSRLNICRDVIDVFETLPGADITGLHSLASRADRDGDVFDTIADLLPWLLSQLVMSLAKETDLPPIFADPAAPAALRTAVPLDRWVEVWENVNTLFRRARALYLDRKQTVQSSFHLIEKAVNAS